MVEQRSPKPSVACSTRVSPAKALVYKCFFVYKHFTLDGYISQGMLNSTEIGIKKDYSIE